MHNFELIQTVDYAKDVIIAKARWYEGDKQFNLIVKVPQDFKMLVDYTYRVKHAFASQMKDHPEALKECLLTLDKIFGTAIPMHEDIYSFTTFSDLFKMSEESEVLWHHAVSSQFAIDGYTKPKQISMDFKLSADDFNKMKQVLMYQSPVPLPNREKKSLSSASYDLPGMKERVKWPCKRDHDECREYKDTTEPLRTVIMYLNDTCRWTREEIADWLETLDIDLTFKTNTKEIENVEG